MVQMTHQFRLNEADIKLMVVKLLQDLYGISPEIDFKITIENVKDYTDEGTSNGSHQEIIATQVSN